MLTTSLLATLLRTFPAFTCDPVRVPLPVPNFEHEYERDAERRDSLIYLLSPFLPELRAIDPTVASVTIPCAELPADAYVALINSFTPEGTFDYIQFRNAIGNAYLDARATQHADWTPPARLEDFVRQTGYRGWTPEVVTRSRIKDLTRAIYHSPTGKSFAVSVAETHESVNGDLNTAIRETEILLKRENGEAKDWDFFVYDATGKLATQSHFRNNTPLPSPGVCMNCHYSVGDRAYVPITRPRD